MIRKRELEQVREINQKLPFAHPIEPGPTFREWTDEHFEFKLLPYQIRVGEALMLGEHVHLDRQMGKTTALRAARHYQEFGTDG